MRILVKKSYVEGIYYEEIAGTSAEASTLPESGLVTGSRFLCVDTGDLYLFDDNAGKWNGPFMLYVKGDD